MSQCDLLFEEREGLALCWEAYVTDHYHTLLHCWCDERLNDKVVMPSRANTILCTEFNLYPLCWQFQNLHKTFFRQWRACSTVSAMTVTMNDKLCSAEAVTDCTFINLLIPWKSLQVTEFSVHHIENQLTSDRNKRLAMLNNAVLKLALMIVWYNGEECKGINSNGQW